MKISAICFDLGKVLLDFDWNRMLNRVAEKSPLRPAQMLELMLQNHVLKSYEVGKTTTPKFLTQLKKALQFKGTTEELRSCFCEIFTPLPENIALAALLAPHYPLAIISNTSAAHIEYAETTYSFFSLFHARVYSHEVGAMKPQREIYDRARTSLGGIDPLEMLFIDDLEANILGAVELGWQTIHLRPEVDLRIALSSYELKGLDQ